MPNSSYPALGLLFLFGLLLFAAGTALRRRATRAPAVEPVATLPAVAVRWPQRVDDALEGAGFAERREMIARLALIGSGWSLETLRAAREEETDEAMLAQIDSALKVSC
ncbi:MAG: hypothetical protein M3R35_08940 [Candidatus Eremiobacteraeota bacterium]|nr:hypothetical protein [Candidatus Eremiobacteraeota bacterium]